MSDNNEIIDYGDYLPPEMWSIVFNKGEFDIDTIINLSKVSKDFKNIVSDNVNSYRFLKSWGLKTEYDNNVNYWNIILKMYNFKEKEIISFYDENNLYTYFEIYDYINNLLIKLKDWDKKEGLNDISDLPFYDDLRHDVIECLTTDNLFYLACFYNMILGYLYEKYDIKGDMYRLYDMFNIDFDYVGTSLFFAVISVLDGLYMQSEVYFNDDEQAPIILSNIDFFNDKLTVRHLQQNEESYLEMEDVIDNPQNIYDYIDGNPPLKSVVSDMISDYAVVDKNGDPLPRYNLPLDSIENIYKILYYYARLNNMKYTLF